MISFTCPMCNAVVELDDMPCIDARLVCRGCGDILKVVTVTPLKLEWAMDDLLESPEYSVRLPGVVPLQGAAAEGLGQPVPLVRLGVLAGGLS